MINTEATNRTIVVVYGLLGARLYCWSERTVPRGLVQSFAS